MIGRPVNQCKSQLFVGLAIELTLHASHKNNNCQVNLRILSNSCYQCFYVLTFILMEIYLFCVHPTIAVSYEFTPESRTVGQLDFKLEATGGWMVALAIPHQSGSAFAVVSILYALKLGWRHIFWWGMEKMRQRVCCGRINWAQLRRSSKWITVLLDSHITAQ